MTAPRNPDCRDGKHRACAGDAWDEAGDVLTSCGCPCHGQHDHLWGATAADVVMTCALCGETQTIPIPEDTTVEAHTCRLIDLVLNDDGTALVCPHGYSVAVPGPVVINGQVHQAGAPTPAGRVRVDPDPTTRKVTGL